MPSTNTPNMGLPIPTVGLQPGPQFATDVNQALSMLDGHTHGPGSGVPIGSQGINLQGDLSFNVNNATAVRTVRFISTTATSGTDVGCVYVKGVDLYYNDINANVVRITSNGGLASTSLTQGILNTTAIISANAPQIPATTGFIRMNNNVDLVSWRNSSNDADNKIYFDNSDTLRIIGPGYNVGMPKTPMTFPVAATSAPALMMMDSDGSVLTNRQATRAQLPTVGLQASVGSSAYFSGVGTTEETVLSVTITTTGRPVYVGLQGDYSYSSGLGGGNNFLGTSYIASSAGTAQAINAPRFGIYRNDLLIYKTQFGGQTNDQEKTVIPPNLINTVDYLCPSSTFTYSFAVAPSLNTFILVNKCVLIAFEM